MHIVKCYLLKVVFVRFFGEGGEASSCYDGLLLLFVLDKMNAFDAVALSHCRRLDAHMTLLNHTHEFQQLVQSL